MTVSDNEEHELNGIANSEEAQVPTYYPLHRDFIGTVESLKPDEFAAKEIDESIKTLIKSAEEYIENSLMSKLEVSTEVLKTALDSLDSLLNSGKSFKVYKNSLVASKATIRNKARSEEPLSFETLDHYVSIDLNVNPQITDVFADNYSHEISLSDNTPEYQISRNKDYRYLKNAVFVLNNPEEPLPDENEDDDLAIEGGKISLKDPITMKLFEKPVMCRKCNHVYEEEIILNNIRQRDSHCPVSGCSAIITIGDLQPDKLMRLRLLAYKNATKKSDDNLDRL